jgi:RNA polymerase sigma-70 factor, ECF subfamily
MSKRKTTIDEGDLIMMLQSRDERGFSILYDNYSSALYGVILKIVRTEEIAADVLQDAFVKIWKNIEGYNRTKGTLFTWMLNVARNTAIDKIRSQDFQNSQRNQDLDSTVEVIDNQANNQFDVDAIGLKKVVENLRPEHHQIVDLLYFQGYTQAEVAEEFGIPLGTVKTRIKAAIIHLRQFFVEMILVIWFGLLDKLM